jgi:protein ImuB
MLWACLLLPHLALDGVLRGHATPDLPLALASGPMNQRVLHDVNDAARRSGLRTGQGLTAARALLPDFLVVDHDMQREKRLQRLLAAAAYRYSSMVCLEGSDAIVLEIQASLGLFGPWPRFERLLRDDLTQLGFRHRIAVAPTAAAAVVFAGTNDGLVITEPAQLRHALGRLPLAASRLPGKTVTALAGMGLRELRQVFALPRAGLARRVGPAIVAQLDRLTGDAPDPRDFYAPPDVFEERIELNYEISHHPALLFPVRRLVNDLAAYLAGRDGGVLRFTIALEHEDHADTDVVVGLLAAERDPSRLFDLARSRLERTAIPAPIRALRLVARELPPFVPAGRDLFDDRPAQAMPWDALRERLRARLGNEAVHQIVTHADPRPEHAMRRIAMLNKDPAALVVPPRPSWLLPRPIPLHEAGLHILAGPERIESGWWDGGDVRRDYYLVRTAQGQRAWAFRPAGATEGAWMLHGWFA